MADIIDRYFSGDVISFVFFMIIVFFFVTDLPQILLAICFFIVLMHFATNGTEQFTATKKQCPPQTDPNNPDPRIEPAKTFLSNTKKIVCLDANNDVVYGGIDDKFNFYGPHNIKSCQDHCDENDPNRDECLLTLFLRNEMNKCNKKENDKTKHHKHQNPHPGVTNLLSPLMAHLPTPQRSDNQPPAENTSSHGQHLNHLPAHEPPVMTMGNHTNTVHSLHNILNNAPPATTLNNN